MIQKLKKLLYFPVASYFKFFARIHLSIWKPTVIVVTGSSGKTTLLHLIESQIGNRAKYSHQANSSYGIPFDILGLHRKYLTMGEWPYLFLVAPFRALKTPPKEKLYVVEADCDRPNEGKFLADLLKPEVTLWTRVGRTHTVNFDTLLPSRHSGKPRSAGHIQNLSGHEVAAARDAGQASMTPVRFASVEIAIAHEFGYFLEATSKLAIVNGDSQFIRQQLKRSKAPIKSVSQKEPNGYKIFKDHTEIKINGKNYSINALLPKETFYSIAMTRILVDYLNQNLLKRHSGKRSASRISKSDGRFWTSQNDEENNTFKKIDLDPSFSKLKLPPGRVSVFQGIKNTTIIDSSYNATPDGVRSILDMFDLYPADKKWLVLGDMIELGNEEKEEHVKLTDITAPMRLEKIILVGPRLLKYTYPKLKNKATMEQLNNETIESFLMPKEALDYLLTHLRGGEAILFKGARFLEGVIEHLLADKNDIKKLCRRERIWQERRKQWRL